MTGGTVCEDSLAVLQMKDTTRGEDVLKSLMDFAAEKKLPLNKLISVCTDGAPSMLGIHKGFVARLCEQEKRPILSFHCIVHQEALCAQSSGEDLREVMSLVVRIVNFTCVHRGRISIGDFELEAAELKVSDMWVSKCITLNSELESLARQRAELAKQHKWADMRKLQREDFQPLSAQCIVSVLLHVCLNIYMRAVLLTSEQYQKQPVLKVNG